MNLFDHELNQRLDELRRQGLFRELRRIDSPQTPRPRVDGKRLLNFSSNDYLGLANDARVKFAAARAARKFGAGAGASRLICGSLAPHHELEETLARFKRTEAALGFSSGYATAIGTICALMTSDDVVVIDKKVHASIVDAARLCGAKLRVFGHNDVDDLEKILRWTRSRGNATRSRTLVITESIFSMDGDRAPLRELVELKDRYGAWLMLDEAHATGVFGPNRRGLAEEEGVGDRIEIQMGTLGKAAGSAGGYICGSRSLVDYLVNRARSFIFSTAPVPAAAAAASAGIRIIQSGAGETRRQALWQRIEQAKSELSALNIPVFGAIVPIILGDETRAVEAAVALRKRGIFIPAVRYPTVARGQARLRLTLTAAHTATDVRKLCAALAQLGLGSAAADVPTQPRANPGPDFE